MTYAAGLDFGTSGARLVVIDADRKAISTHQVTYQTGDGRAWEQLWLDALSALLTELPPSLRQKLGAIAINGTSGTVLLCDKAGQPITAPLLYDDDRGKACSVQLEPIAPAGSPVLSATSSLVKLLWWRESLSASLWQRARYFYHQADWLAFQLHGVPGLSDYHNALKLGYDVGQLAYPDWLLNLGLTPYLPQVRSPGSVMGVVAAEAGERWGLSPHCVVVAGTTDSIAAFLASGARSPGEAVTSLGSTLVIKLLSETRVDDSRYGIYSHRLGDLWLVGGASNTGGAVLKQFFTDAELRALSEQIAGDRASELNYYPLTQPGERFPINDPEFAPRLTPRPADPAIFLHGLLEGIARIEAQGYRLLTDLGATPLQRIWTAGGGAQNLTWLNIRQRILPVPVAQAASTEAALGTAYLASKGLLTHHQESFSP